MKFQRIFWLLLASIFAFITATKGKEKSTTEQILPRVEDVFSSNSNDNKSSFVDKMLTVVQKSDEERSPENMTADTYILQWWLQAEKLFEKGAKSFTKFLMPYMIRALKYAEVSPMCESSLIQTVFAMRSLRTWSFQMLDAFGKPPAGMLRGTVTSFGAFDECVSIVARPENSNSAKEYFRGKYCTVEIRPPLPPKPSQYTIYQPLNALANFSKSGDNVVRQAARIAHAFYFLSYRMDVCVPSTCTQEDVNNLAQLASRYIDINVTVPRCAVKEDLKLEDDQIGILFVIGILMLFVLLGTMLDIFEEIFHKVKKVKVFLSNRLSKVMLAFSMNKNGLLLLDTNVPQNGLGCLHGMRFVCMAWIMMGNTYHYGNIQVYSNLREATNYVDSVLFQVVFNSNVALDTFFFISGVMISYLTLQYSSKFGKFSIPRFFLRRFFRLTPPYMVVIALAILLPLVGSGPFWHETVDPITEKCRKNWWTNLLYVNNFAIAPDQRCLEHSWYLSCDFQLYIMSLLVLIPLTRWPIVGLAINFLLVFLSIFITGFLTYYFKFPPTLLVTYPDPEERNFLNDVILSKPYCHLGPYCIGIAIGYLFFVCPGIRLKPYQQVLGWGGACALNSAVVYGVYEWNRGNLPSLPVALAYAATHRTAWALGLAWLTFICVSGYGGIINRILSWKAFIPLSRLTYMAYLVHPLIQYILTGYIRERIASNHIIAAYFFFGHLMTSYALSAFFYLMFDSPVMVLKKMLFGKNTPSAPRMSLHALGDSLPPDYLERLRKIAKKSGAGNDGNSAPLGHVSVNHM